MEQGKNMDNTNNSHIVSDSNYTNPSEIRKLDIENSIDELSGNQPRHQERYEETSRRLREKGTGRFVKQQVDQPSETESDVQAAEKPEQPSGAPEVEAQPTQQAPESEPTQPTPQLTAPTSWTKEAKEAFNSLPDRIKQEVVKREQDMQKGVDAIKRQVADIDGVFKEHFDLGLKQQNITRGQFLNSIAGFTKGLSGFNPSVTPAQTLGALAQSYGISYDEAIAVMEAMKHQQPQPQFQQNQPQFQQQAYRDPRVDYLLQAQEEVTREKNQSILDNFASNHPHFEKVRATMGMLMTPNQLTGQALVPMKDGKLDFETAYQRALAYFPEIQAEEAARAEAERLAKQKEEASRRKAASVSIPSKNAPGGAPVGAKKPEPKRPMTVRESLRQAIQDLQG